EVQAFEPSPTTAARLRRNVSFNNLDLRVAVNECALGAEEGIAEFSRGTDTTNHVIGEGESRLHSDRVLLRRFDSFFSATKPGFMKIDVEGFEEQVLAGA